MAKAFDGSGRTWQSPRFHTSAGPKRRPGLGIGRGRWIQGLETSLKKSRLYQIMMIGGIPVTGPSFFYQRTLLWQHLRHYDAGNSPEIILLVVLVCLHPPHHGIPVRMPIESLGSGINPIGISLSLDINPIEVP